MAGREKARETGRPAGSLKSPTDKKVPGAGEVFPQWLRLSCENIKVVMKLSVDQVQLRFANVLNLKKHQTCVNEASLLSYFVTGFWWAKQMNFTSQQISFIMALLQLLLDNIKDQHMSFADNLKEFTRMLLTTRQSSTRSASTTFNPLFDVDQIKSITDYFMSSLFQHYSLYEFLFTHPRDDMLLTMERTVEVVNSADFIAPLEEGTPIDDHHRGLSPASSPDQDLDTSMEKNEEESGECEHGERPENLESFSVEDVREVLGEATREMLVKLQADFSEKLHIQEQTYTARLESLKRLTSKKL